VVPGKSATGTNTATSTSEVAMTALATSAMAPDDARRANHAMAREVGLPLMRGLIACDAGDGAEAVRQLAPLVRLGAANPFVDGGRLVQEQGKHFRFD